MRWFLFGCERQMERGRSLSTWCASFFFHRVVTVIVDFYIERSAKIAQINDFNSQ